jgi:mitochondrial fission protein ELM1
VALAHALGVDARVLRIDVAAPWRWLAPRLLAGARSALREHNGAPIAPPWPRLAIGCGRQAALLTRALRRWSGGDCFTVQILDPRIDTAHFDVVVAPRHDHVAGSNVIETIGSLHAIDDAWLASARTRFAALAVLPAPRTAVLIGASNTAQTLDAAYFVALQDRLAALHAREGGSFLVSTSRRTRPAIAQRLRDDFARWPGVFWHDERDGENPYAGLLAWADRLVVTPDSVNLLSEACATGKPVATFTSQPVQGKLAELHATLIAEGHLSALDEATEHSATGPLREIPAVVASIISMRQCNPSTRNRH